MGGQLPGVFAVTSQPAGGSHIGLIGHRRSSDPGAGRRATSLSNGLNTYDEARLGERAIVKRPRRFYARTTCRDWRKKMLLQENVRLVLPFSDKIRKGVYDGLDLYDATLFCANVDRQLASPEQATGPWGLGAGFSQVECWPRILMV